MYKIGEFSKLTGVPVKTLRYYDEIGLFKPSHIEDSNYRYYEEYQIDEIKYILSLKKLNLSLQEIKEYIEKHNMKIIEEKEQKSIENSKEISEYILTNSKYAIELSDYDTFIDINGLAALELPYGKAMKENQARSYLIYKNGQYHTNIIFNIVNHKLDCGPSALETDEELKMIINQLASDGFNEVVMEINDSVYRDILDRISRVLNIVKVEEVEELKKYGTRNLYIQGVKDE